MSNITVLGMGAMGSRMAISLLKAGHQVTVWNRSQEKTKPLADLGAKVETTPRIAVATADVVISMVRDDRASEAVWLDPQDGALGGLDRNTIAIASSTLSLAWTKKLGKKLQQHGISFLDAPVTGSRKQADAAALIYFVGGDAASIAKVQPILATMGSKVISVGAVGSGMGIKLAINALFGIQISAFAELLGLLKSYGLNENRAVEIITATPVCSNAVKTAAAAIITRNFAPMFPIELVAKDLTYAIDTASANNTDLPITEQARTVFNNAIECGYGDDNITGIAQLYF